MIGLDLDLDGVGHPLRGEAHDLVVQRRAVEQGLAAVAVGQAADDAAYVGDEAHVEHAVGLVDDQSVDVAQVDHTLALEVEQASGRGGEQVYGAIGELALLADVVHAAEDGEAAEAAVFAERLGIVADLHAELARGGDDEGARRAGLVGASGGRTEVAREDGDEKGGGLAGAGLGASGDIGPGERLLQAGGLDRRAVLEAEVGDGVHDHGREVEVMEPLAALGRGHLERLDRPGLGGDRRLDHRRGGGSREAGFVSRAGVAAEALRTVGGRLTARTAALAAGRAVGALGFAAIRPFLSAPGRAAVVIALG